MSSTHWAVVYLWVSSVPCLIEIFRLEKVGLVSLLRLRSRRKHMMLVR
jgi:hypothetical protein